MNWRLERIVILCALSSGCQESVKSASLRETPTTGREVSSAKDSTYVVGLGHGAYILNDGSVEMEFSPSLRERTLNHYLNEISNRQPIKERSTNRLLLEDSSIIRKAQALEELISQVTLPNAATLEQINRAIRIEEAKDNPGANNSGEFRTSSSRLSTELQGAEYIELCRSQQVPVPDTVLDEGDSRWTSHGILSTNLIGGNAEVWTYESTSPAGVCIALPRWNSNDEAMILGLICMSKVNGKTCFFENPNPSVWGTSLFPRGETLDINEFVGGADLVPNAQGVCSDCHSGENPFVLHPADPAFASASAVGLFPPQWYEPIVASSWPKNPGPLTRLGPTSGRRCDGCHGGSGMGRGVAGRLPIVSREIPNYCSFVLRNAVTPVSMGGIGTMPVGGDPTDYADHINWLISTCSTRPGSGTVVDVDFNPEQNVVSKPTVGEPLYECTDLVEVSGAQLNAELRIYVNSVHVDTRIVRDPDSEIFKVGTLSVGDTVQARQIVGAQFANSDIVVVKDYRADYPTGLPPPNFNPTTVHECASTLAIQHIRGASFEIERISSSGTTSRNSRGGSDYTWVSMGSPFDVGEEFRVRQSLCGDPPSPWSDSVVAISAPSPLPDLGYNPPALMEGQELITLTGITEGAGLDIEESGVGSIWSMRSWPTTWKPNIDIVPGLGGPIETHHNIFSTQTLCEGNSSEPREPPVVRTCEELDAPIIASPVAGTDYVIVLYAVPGATIRILDVSGQIGGGAGTVVRLTRPLVAGEVITVIQEVGECTGRLGYSISVVSQEGENEG